jgi:hypothetical protein
MLIADVDVNMLRPHRFIDFSHVKSKEYSFLDNGSIFASEDYTVFTCSDGWTRQAVQKGTCLC